MTLEQLLAFNKAMKNERRSAINALRVSEGSSGVRSVEVEAPRAEAGEAGGESEERYDNEGNARHYATAGCECIDAIKAATEGRNGYEGYLIGQCLKYLWRAGKKDDYLQDLIKTKWYLNRLICYIKALK